MRRLVIPMLLLTVVTGCRTVGGPVTQTVGSSIWAAKGDGFRPMRPVRKAMIGATVMPWTLKADRAIRRAESRR